MSAAVSLAFSSLSPCLRSIALTFGNWAERSPFAQHDDFNIVWHVRLGDIELKPPFDPFYERLLKCMSGLLSDFNSVKFFFIAEWELINADHKQNYASFSLI